MELHFDYIIAGAGCAGLSLAYKMSIDPFFDDKKILLIDKDDKNKQDRTWCFWEDTNSVFEEIVSSSWKNIAFKSTNFAKTESIHPYVYKMIRSENFYAFCLGKINRKKNITALKGDIAKMVSNGIGTYIEVNAQKIYAAKIFSSILLEEPNLKPTDIYLLQHFTGWVIETKQAQFNADVATIMDFSIAQTHGTSFVYVLPMSSQKALVEYTLFTEEVLDETQYQDALKNYIANHLHITDYNITEREFGVIPMTNYQFKRQDNHIHFIGTAGGATKASSGYTFTFIQQQTNQIITKIKNNAPIDTAITPAKFTWYDAILLHLLATKMLGGKEIFTRLFQKNKFVFILQFLNNSSTLPQEINMMRTLQIGKFIKAAWQRLF